MTLPEKVGCKKSVKTGTTIKTVVRMHYEVDLMKLVGENVYLPILDHRAALLQKP